MGGGGARSSGGSGKAAAQGQIGVNRVCDYLHIYAHAMQSWPPLHHSIRTEYGAPTCLASAVELKGLRALSFDIELVRSGAGGKPKGRCNGDADSPQPLWTSVSQVKCSPRAPFKGGGTRRASLLLELRAEVRPHRSALSRLAAVLHVRPRSGEASRC